MDDHVVQYLCATAFTPFVNPNKVIPFVVIFSAASTDIGYRWKVSWERPGNGCSTSRMMTHNQRIYVTYLFTNDPSQCIVATENHSFLRTQLFLGRYSHTTRMVSSRHISII